MYYSHIGLAAWQLDLSECRDLCLQAQNAPDRMPYSDPTSGFAKAVGGKAPHTDQHSHSPDEVLASNFGRKLNLEDGSQGQPLHTLAHRQITCSTSKPYCFLPIVGWNPYPVCVHSELHTLANYPTTTQVQVFSDKSLFPAGARMHASQSAQRLGSSGDTSTSGRPSVDSESSSLAPGRQQQPVHPGMNTR